MSQSSENIDQLKQATLNEEYVQQLEAEVYRQGCLPHLYGQHWYKWQWDFFNSTAKYNVLSAANQIGKSTCQIRKCIHWATEPKLWQGLWPGSKPTQFWYFYPDQDVATTEFEEKWVKEWMPCGEYENHPQYGWTADYQKKKIYSIRFNTGVTVYFKTYSQNPKKMQASTLFSIFADEEMPIEFYDELNMRIIRLGFFHVVFTATIGQEFWADVMDNKLLNQNCFKKKVSMYDCLVYYDAPNVPTPWTKEKIETEVIPSCKSDLEVRRRVFGDVVQEGGRMFPAFSRERNVTPGHKLPADWIIYSGVDIGSGGDGGHPAAMAFVACSPDFTKGRIFRGWRGDGIRTTAGDILVKYRALKKGLTSIALQSYDHAAADFYTIACRCGEAFTKAEKDRDRGIDLLNTLFELEILKIHDDDPELEKLVKELLSLKKSTKKQNAKDDFCDAVRFAVTPIPWNYEALNGKPLPGIDPYEGMTKRERDYEREKAKRAQVIYHNQIEAEFAEINELYGEGFY
jgi:hypothetical protein